MVTPIRLLIVEDDQEVLLGLRMRLGLAGDIAVIGDTGEGDAVLAMALEFGPDVVLVDLRAPGAPGLRTCLLLCEAGFAVVILGFQDEPNVRARSLAAGAAAFVSKQDSPAVLVTAIRLAHRPPG